MDVLLISGPTAAGKSSAARRLAGRLGGEIINADAIQVYREWRLLSARPSRTDMASVRHHLFGHIPAAQDFSAGDWLKAAAAAIDNVRDRGHLPIVAGGTGLYFRCLTQGLAAMPDVPKAIRENLRARLQRDGVEALHRSLADIDPELAARLPVKDRQRVLRGLEVFEATGIPLTQWQQRPVAGLKANFIKYALLPPRDVLDGAADDRVDRMVAAGVLDEVSAFMKLDLPPSRPAMKALGLAAFRSHLDGALSLEEAVDQVKSATRRYIRRQLTWIRTQMADWVKADDEAALYRKIMRAYAP